MKDQLGRIAGLSMRTSLIIAAVVTMFWYSSMFDDGSAIDARVMSTNTKIAEEEKKSKESDLALKAFDEIQSSISTLGDQFKVAAQQLPTEIGMADILRSVDALAKSANVNLKLKEPKTAKREDIVELTPLRVVAEGTYSEVVMFIYYLSSMERITRAVNFSFTPVLATKSNSRTQVYAGRVAWDGEIINYRYIGEQEAPKDQRGQRR